MRYTIVLLNGPLDRTVLDVDDPAPSLFFPAYPKILLAGFDDLDASVEFEKLEYERITKLEPLVTAAYLYKASPASNG